MIYLDKIIHFFFKSKHNFNKEVILNDFIIKTEEIKKKEVLCVFCPPWHIGRFATAFLRKRLYKKNYSYLTYDIHPDVFSSDYISTKKYLEEIISKINKDVIFYKKKHNFKKIYIIGISLGCLYAINVAVKNKYIDKVILASPGYSLQDSVWTGYTTKNIKNTMIHNYNITYKKLKKEWTVLSPYDNIEKLKDKEVLIFASKRDCLTSYKGALKLIKILEENKVNLKKQINTHLGHYATIAKFLLFPKKYI
jgi:predicted esterase